MEFTYGDYDGLSLAEARFIEQYLRTHDKNALIEFIRENNDLSDGFRQFQGDVLSGNIKRGKGQGKDDYNGRDWLIYCKATALMQKEKLTLKESVEKIAKDTGFRGGINAALRAYYMGESHQIKHEIHIGVSRLMYEQGLSLDEAATEMSNRLNIRESRRNGRGNRKTYTKDKVIELYNIS